MKLFSKDNDYNLILEKILDSKYFSSNTKNLLLSMIYKIENCYEDYKKVKGIEKSKDEFLEELIEIIKKYCDNIKLVEPDSKDAEIMKNNNVLALTNEKERSILSYPTEIALLYAISDILPKYFYISESFLLKNAFQLSLVNGYNQNNLEVLADFNGWSWDINLNLKNNITDNLIYQNFIILFGLDFLDKWLECSSKNEEPLEKIKSEFTGTKYFEILCKYLYDSSSDKDKNKIDKIIKSKKTELDKISDKPKYFEEIKKEKLKYLKEVERIDKLLSDKEKLMKKYISDNLKLEEGKRFSTVKAYQKMLKNKRENCLSNITDLTSKMKPMNYINYKKELEDTIKIAEYKLEDEEQIKVLQIEFIKKLKEKVEELEDEEEIINFIYKIRYYQELYINKDIKIKSCDNLNLDEVWKTLITKACKKSILRTVVLDVNLNSKIIQNIVDTKIIDLQEIRFEVVLKDNKILVKVYEKEVYEKDFGLDFNIAKKELLVKQSKFVKLFI